MVDLTEYTVVITWSDDDAGFIARVPALPGCSAYGESRRIAADEVEDAMSAWVQAALEAGNPIPEPP